MTNIVFYPAMGVDIITPLVCIPTIDKIIATGPIHTNLKQFGKGAFEKGAIEKTMNFICKLIVNGTNEFYEGRNVDEDQFIEFLIEEGVIMKKYHFKKKEMFLIHFKYNDRLVKLYYYYNIDPEKKWTFKESFTHVIHKDYKLSVHSDKNFFLKNLMPLIKTSTKLISDKSTIRGIWHISKKAIHKIKPIQEYERIVQQTKYRSLDTGGQFKSLMNVPLTELFYI